MKNDRLLRACRSQPVDRAPVWIMRQAGRYLPEFRAVRSRADLLTLCKTPELAVEVSLQPYQVLGVDAVIAFSDILLPVEVMGLKLRPVEGRGLAIETPLRKEADVDRLVVPDPLEKAGYVMEIIRRLRRDLLDEAPLIGYAAAPYTLAAYMVEGRASRNYTEIKQMLFAQPALLHKLLGKITVVIVDYLNAQIEAGAQVIQLFDTCAGDLSAVDFEEFALPYQQQVFDKLHRGPQGLGVPAILYANGSSHVLEKMAESGANVLSLDWRIDIGKARRRLDAAGFEHLALQGNLDPGALLGAPETIAEGVHEILKKVGPVGHIMNLGHGIWPMVPVENARAFVNAAKAGFREVA